MKISAGYELYQRNPRLAPTSEPQKIVSSADGRKVHEQQIVRQDAVPRHVRECGECCRRDRKRADGEPVEAVGQVHGVRRADQHDNRKRDVPPAEIRNERLEKRKDQPGVYKEGC